MPDFKTIQEEQLEDTARSAAQSLLNATSGCVMSMNASMVGLVRGIVEAIVESMDDDQRKRLIDIALDRMERETTEERDVLEERP